MATDKTPTQAERIDALEDKISKFEKALKRFDAIEEALATGDPTAVAMLYAKKG